MSNDVRNIKNIREKPTHELMAEYKVKEKQQRELDKAHKEAIREEKRRGHIGKLQVKKTQQKAKLQEHMETQKQKAEIKRLRHETGMLGKAQKLHGQLKKRQFAMQKKRTRPTIKGSPKKKEFGKVYIIKGTPYHYKGGRLVKVPIGKTKTKKKKESWGL